MTRVKTWELNLFWLMFANTDRITVWNNAAKKLISLRLKDFQKATNFRFAIEGREFVKRGNEIVEL